MSFEFEIKGKTFSTGKMSGIVQVHVLRRASPIVKPLFNAIKGGFSPDVAGEIIAALGDLDDAATEYILKKTLAVVKMKEETGWSKVVSGVDSLDFMNDEIGGDAYMILAIVSRVLGYNYEPLFREALSSLPDGAIPTFQM